MNGNDYVFDDVPGPGTPRREEAGGLAERIPPVKESRSWAQLAIIVADGSESMTWELQPDTSIDGQTLLKKADAVDVATRDLVNRLAASSKSANFDFAYVAFHNHAADVRDPQPVKVVSGSFDPTANGYGGTNYAAGLERAEQIARAYLDTDHDGLTASVVILLLGDGQDNNSRQAAVDAAARIKGMKNTQIAACFFATKDDPDTGADLLQELASVPRLYSTVYNAQQLRKFFHESVSAAGFEVA